MLLTAVVVVIAMWAVPTTAQGAQGPGPVGWRWIPELGQAYCDNFYDGPPMATTPSGAPWTELQQQQVHWCYSEALGYWVPTSPTYYS
jgi:hypothetical protein